MRKLILGGLLAVMAGAANAQQFCTADAGNVPACMVGIWSGSNDMADRMEQIFAQMPEDVAAAARASSGQYLFMVVADNGRFVTSPMEAAVDVNFLNKDGSVDWLENELTAAGTIGQYTVGSGDAISFCMESPGPDTLTTKAEGAAGSIQQVMPLPAAGAGSVAMRYECAGDALKMYVDLPPPIGTVTYDLFRIPADALPSDLTYLLSRE